MIRNSNDAWGWPAIALHWIVALLVLTNFALGLWMGELPRPERPYWYGLHASIGITLLVILVARIAWTLSNPAPAPAAGTPAWHDSAARFTHVALYILTLATVLFGWFMAGVRRVPIVPEAFGIVPLPSPIAIPGSKDFFEEAHEIAAYALIGLAAAHMIVALWHHYVLRNATLRRMLGGRGATT
jgi:cytochrome b561